MSSEYDLPNASAAYRSLLNILPGEHRKGVVGRLRHTSIYMVYDRAGETCRWVDDFGNVWWRNDVVEEYEAYAIATMSHFARHGGQTPSRVIESEMPDTGSSYRPAKPVERALFVYPYTDSVFGIASSHLR